jgi:hypothetical protein
MKRTRFVPTHIQRYIMGIFTPLITCIPMPDDTNPWVAGEDAA